MREILFRGKDVRGEWHLGLLAHVGNAWYISNKAGVATAYEVRPETVSQFTGLTDKNGKRIFEGDIVKHYFRSDKPEVFDTGVIFWHQAKCRFLRTSQDLNFNPEVWSSSAIDYEIIGNIYGNPELMEASV